MTGAMEDLLRDAFCASITAGTCTYGGLSCCVVQDHPAHIRRASAGAAVAVSSVLHLASKSYLPT